MQFIECFDLQINNEIIALRSMSAWLGKACESLAVPDEIARDLDVCANEAVANVIFYAYEDDDSHSINMRLELKDQKLIFTIEDDGIAFDPFKAILSESYDKIGDITIGGFGIKLIRSLVNECSYDRFNSKNIMNLVFHLCPTSPISIPGENSPFLTSCNY
ncbi:MAG: Serine/threonine-protein kinase BtrW [Pseudomonadota bacterium]|jgi:serine/threonine-protein kinase RsbW